MTMALTAASFFVLLLVLFALGHTSRLDVRYRQRATARRASQTGPSALAVEVTPAAVNTAPAAEVATKAFSAAVGKTPAKPKPEAAQDTPTTSSHAMEETLIDAVRGLLLTEPDLGVKPLVAKLQVQQAHLRAGTKEVREAMTALKAEKESESEPAAPSTALPTVDEGSAPSDVALSLACAGCSRLPSDMDDGREKHPLCPKCREHKLPTTYFCSLNCPAFPEAWKRHKAWHKEVQLEWKLTEKESNRKLKIARREAERIALLAEQTGDEYTELMGEAARYYSEKDWRKAARVCREAIALRPDEGTAYANLAFALSSSGHYAESVKRYLEAKERYQVDSEQWAQATSMVFLAICENPQLDQPDWWNDEDLRDLSARVMRAAPNMPWAYMLRMRVLTGVVSGAQQGSAGEVLSGGQRMLSGAEFAWEVGSRSAVELMEAAALCHRLVALMDASETERKAWLVQVADVCRSKAEAIIRSGAAGRQQYDS